MTNPQCPHGHTYGTCLMCYHDLVAEQQSDIERLRAALVRYGRHDSHGMSDQPGCQKARMGGGACTCGLDAALGGNNEQQKSEGVLTITRDVTTVSPNFKVTATTVSDVTRGPCPLCGRTDNHTHAAGPLGMS